jgi:mono/diheme cytochrome c family protein
LRRLPAAWAIAAFAAAVAGLTVGSAAVSSDGASGDARSTDLAFDRSAIDSATVVRGAQLAAIGNCGTCHTRAGGEPYAGGRPMETPFGTIHSTNITPDPATGIGAWSEEDFLRSMHDGVAPGGRNLYPAFPYDHFTKVTDEDIKAIYAFVMTRDPVEAEAPRNRLAFPFNLRPLLAVWKALYLKPGVYRPDPLQSGEWNRGAYLVEGLGHCGACHTPHDALGGEESRRSLAGGEAGNWLAPAMDAGSPAPAPWTVEQLFNYLRRGYDDAHGVAAGPMASVVHNLSLAPERDVRAIALYVASMMPRTDGRRIVARGGTPATEGATIYAGACATCHGTGVSSPTMAPTMAPTVKTTPLELTTSVNAPDPRNTIHIVLNGIWPQTGDAGALMPGFAGELTEQQTAALIEYLRREFSAQPAWNDVPDRLRIIARSGDIR